MPSLATDATGEERAAFAAGVRATVVARLRWIVVPGVLVCAAVSLVGLEVYGLGRVGIIPPAVAALALIAAGAGTYVPALARRPHLLYGMLSVVFAAAIGEVAASSGGFASPFCYCLLLVWFFGAALAGLGPWALAAFVAIQTVTMAGWIAAAGGSGSPWLVGVVYAGGAAFCVVGAWFRRRGELESHVAHVRLAAAHAEKVAESVARAREIETLDAQLRTRVQERARELALALERLTDGALPALRRGDVIADRVEVIRALGEGGMGVVYEGHDRLTDRRVAVKLLRAGVHPDAMRRFVVEAAAAAAIDHPAIARTVHVDVTAEGRLFHVMELIEGCTLERALTQVAFEPEEGARLVAHVAEAVAAAHARGIVHRDIKPGNVMLSVAAPGVRVLDFGVSKIMDDAVSGGGSRTRGLLGTPRYMAPEQREGGEVGPAADVYSIGMVLEEVMTGITRKGGSADGPTPPALVGELIGILARCLAAQPEARPTAAELAGVLDDYARRHRAPPAAQIAARVIGRVQAEEPIDSAKTIDSARST